MLLNRGEIKKILFITLSNIGDVILTFPSLDKIRSFFPDAQLHVMVGPKAIGLFENLSAFERVIVFDKHLPFWRIAKLALLLRKEKYDLVIDLRHSALPVFLGSKYHTALFRFDKSAEHMKDKHLHNLAGLIDIKIPTEARTIVLNDALRDKCDDFLNTNLRGEAYAVLAPGSANHAKQWTVEGYAEIADYLIEKHKLRIVFVGDLDDRVYISYIQRRMEGLSFDLSGNISLLELSGYLAKARLAVVNDSAPMHLASYFDVPVVAFFGPTNPLRYGPWGKFCAFMQNNKDCQKCKNDSLKLEHTCMSAIKIEAVKETIVRILEASKSAYEKK